MRIQIICLLIVLSVTAFSQAPFHLVVTNSEAGLIPEGIAYDTATNSFYISSIQEKKIVRIDKNGHSQDFISTGQDSFMQGLGMKIDNERNLLWAISIDKKDKLYSCSVHGFNIVSGKTVYHFMLSDTVPHLFNDLVIDDKGIVWITDTFYGALYTVSPENNSMDLFLKDSLLKYCNGIVSINGNKLITTSYPKGPTLVNTETKQLQTLKGISNNKIARGLDGLVLFKNKLISIYNGSNDTKEQGIYVFELNKAMDSVIKEGFLDKGNIHFQEPTTAAIGGSQLYVLANSYIEMYNRNKESTAGIEDKLAPVKVLVYDLSLPTLSSEVSGNQKQ